MSQIDTVLQSKRSVARPQATTFKLHLHTMLGHICRQHIHKQLLLPTPSSLHIKHTTHPLRNSTFYSYATIVHVLAYYKQYIISIGASTSSTFLKQHQSLPAALVHPLLCASAQAQSGSSTELPVRFCQTHLVIAKPSYGCASGKQSCAYTLVARYARMAMPASPPITVAMVPMVPSATPDFLPVSAS